MSANISKQKIINVSKTTPLLRSRLYLVSSNGLPMSFYLIIILIGFISSLSTLLIKNDKIIFRLFSLFLLTTFIIEFVANKMAERKQNNTFIYNLFSVLEFCFYFFFFHSALKGYLKKIKITFIIILYIVLALINIFLIREIYYPYLYIYFRVYDLYYIKHNILLFLI